MELLLYWRSISKRKWWVLGCALLLAVITAVVVSSLTPVYRATVTLMIEQNRTRLISIEEVYSSVSPNREHYQTQTEMLKSPALATKVIERLNLIAHPEFDPRQRKDEDLLSRLGLASGSDSGVEWTPDRLAAAVLSDFLKRITIEPVRLTQIVKVSFDATDRELAARIANAIAESYIEADLEMRASITQRAGDWLAERLAGLKETLEESERALQRYRESQGLVDTRGLAQTGAPRQIEELSRGLNELRQRRTEAENAQNQIKAARDKREGLPVVLRTPAIDRLQTVESQAERNVAALSNRYGPEHPRMIQAQADLNKARANTRRGIDAVLASYAKEYEAATADERAIQRSLASAKGTVRDINRKEFQLEALEQDVVTNRQLYERFLTRYRDTRMAGDAQSSVARVVDAAVPPPFAYKPRKTQIVGIAFALGLLLGAMGALLRERVDSSVKSGDEVEEKLSLPTLAILPRLMGSEGASAGRHYLEQPKSVFSEAIRTARTSLLLSDVDQQRKILLITSSLPGEGKSAFAINLALAHAQTKRTLLLEGDLRRPSLVAQLGLDPEKPGLTDLLTKGARFSECVQRVPGSALYVLPSGPIPENPLEAFSSENFRQILAQISAACEIVIIDSPPVHLVSDAVVLSTLATGVLFVVKAESTPYPLARRCIRTMEEAGANLIGVALNQLDFSKADRYYGSYTAYSQEYGGYQAKSA